MLDFFEGDMSSMRATAWSDYADQLLQNDIVYKNAVDVLEQMHDVVIVSMHNPAALSAAIQRKSYALIVTEHVFTEGLLPIIRNAKTLVFLSPTHRLTFLQSLPKNDDKNYYPFSMVLPPPKPAVGSASTNSGVIGILIPDDGDQFRLLNLERELVFLKNYNERYSFVFYTYSETQQQSLLHMSTDIKSIVDVQAINLMDRKQCQNLSVFPSILFTFDSLTTSPFAYALRKILKTPVVYLSDAVLFACDSRAVNTSIFNTLLNRIEQHKIIKNDNPFVTKMLSGY